MDSSEKPLASEMERLATSSEPSLLTEFLEFLGTNQKWFLIPILIVLAGVGVVAALASTPAIAPFLYSLF